MTRYMPQDILRAVIIFAAVTAITLRTAGRRPAVAADMTDIAGQGTANAPGTPDGGPGSSVEQMDYIFHELHPDGRHALCAVCGSSTP
jgi:hypothetical protein